MTAEALAFAIGVLLFLTLVGLGITELMLPKAEGFGPLLAPAVGLAISVLSFQWLSMLLPPFFVAVIVLVAFGALSLVVGWHRRATLFARTPDLLGAAASTLAFYLGLLQIVIQRGFFTLGGLASDNVFIYAPAAQYLLDHPIPSALHPLTLENPGSLYFVSSGVTMFPNSVGQIDAAASVLSGWPVYAVFDPLNALCVALTIGPLWFLVRAGLGGSLWTGVAAAAVLATNQLMYWLVGCGFQQEAEALPVFLAALVVAAHAWRSESSRTGGLAGILAGALPGLYLPIAVLVAICALGGLLIHAVIGPTAHRVRLLRPLGWAIAGGVASASMAMYILIFHGGLATWLSIVGTRIPAGAVSFFPSFPYLFGTLPFAHVWELSLRPLKPYERLAFPALIAASAGLVALLLIGQLRATLQRRVPEAAVLAAGMLFVAYELVIAHYPYGYVKSIGYMAPLTSAFVAFGAVGLGSLVKSQARRTFSRAAGSIGVLALVFVAAASTLASRDMVQTWTAGEPTLPRSLLSLASLSSAVPVGASVFVDYPSGDYSTLVKVAAIAYFLPDRQVRIFTGDLRLGTFSDQNVRPQSCQFDYVIGSAPPDGDFTLFYPDPSAGLNVYRRGGAACS
jgi:hypothetical protein